MSSNFTDSWSRKKQDKVIRHGEPVLRLKKGSLKKPTVCKKTKGNHVFEWRPFNFYKSLETVQGKREHRIILKHQVCKLCGKQKGYDVFCGSCDVKMVKDITRPVLFARICHQCGRID